MHFTRTISVKHHPTGDHYSLSIPAQVAQALGLQDGGGLVSIEVKPYKLPYNKKAVSLKSYCDSDFAWREQFDPSGPDPFRPVVIPPRTLGPSTPWGSGKVFDLKADLKDFQAAIRWLKVAVPSRRGRRRRRRW
jgi:hypothetical protein